MTITLDNLKRRPAFAVLATLTNEKATLKIWVTSVNTKSNL